MDPSTLDPMRQYEKRLGCCWSVLWTTWHRAFGIWAGSLRLTAQDGGAIPVCDLSVPAKEKSVCTQPEVGRRPCLQRWGDLDLDSVKDGFGPCLWNVEAQRKFKPVPELRASWESRYQPACESLAGRSLRMVPRRFCRCFRRQRPDCDACKPSYSKARLKMHEILLRRSLVINKVLAGAMSSRSTRSRSRAHHGPWTCFAAVGAGSSTGHELPKCSAHTCLMCPCS